MSTISQILSYTPKIKKILHVSGISLSILALLLSTSQGLMATATAHNRIVSENPVNYTPNIKEGVANKIHQVGDTMYVGGEFQNIKRRGVAHKRSNLVAFNAHNGMLTNFAPTFDGTVWSLASNGNDLYVGGKFKHVNGKPMRGVAKFNLNTGQLDSQFKSPIPWGQVRELGVVNGRLILGGTFPDKIISANLTNGARNNYINLPVTGTVNPKYDGSMVYRFAINPQQNRLVAIGDFTHVGGVKRYRSFMLNLGANTTSLNAWYYPPLEDNCVSVNVHDYVRGVDFSPDGSYFVLATTGNVARPGRLNVSLCDVAARFETNITRPSRPTWINHTGGDTMQSVAISGATVYVQGHFRWLDNPQGRDRAGPGAVSRRGIGSIDPNTGKATSWNPKKDRGIGGKHMLITDQGLWVVSDTNSIGGEWRQRVALLPL